MIDITTIKDNSIIVCPSNIKQDLLKVLDKNKSTIYIKFLSKHEIVKGLYFDYDYSSLYYVHKKYNLSYSNAQEILDTLCGPLKDCSEKTHKLIEIYTDLKNNSLLKFNPLFKEIFNNKNIYIIGYSPKDIELTNLLDSINAKYEFVSDTIKNYNHTVHTFKSINEEILFVFNSIAKLISEGVSLNDIFLYRYPGEYQLILDKYRLMSNIPMEIKEDKNLSDSPIYNEYINLLIEKKPIEAYNELSEKTILDEYNFLPKLSSLIVDLSPLNLDNDEFIEILNYLASKKSLSNTRYDNAIRIINSFNDVKDNQYVFMIGFDVNNYPIVNKDIDYLTDKEKEYIGRNTSDINNKIEKDKLVKFILNTKNLLISFKEKNNKLVYYPSLLIKELMLNEEKGIIEDTRYFNSLMELEIAKYKDDYYKYGEFNEYMNMFDNKTLKYRDFDHRFKQININNLNKKIKLSYTSINEYYECPFKYFVGYVLNASTFESTYSKTLGTLFHKILEDSISKEINFDDYKEDIEKNFVSAKDKFFLNMHFEQLKEVLEKNEDFINKSFFKKEEVIPEANLSFEIDKNVTLTGKIDKSFIDNTAQKIAVVDYKTGYFEFKQEYMKYGLCLQLPIYKLLLENKYPNHEIIGLFIQKILVDIKNEKEEKEKYYLDGIFSSDVNNLKILDGDFLSPVIDEETGEEKTNLHSNFIKGLSFLSSMKGLTKKAEERIIPDDLSSTCKEKVLEAAYEIRANNFPISPIMHEKNKDSLVCKFCSYKDVCFMKRTDIKILKKEDE